MRGADKRKKRTSLAAREWKREGEDNVWQEKRTPEGKKNVYSL